MAEILELSTVERPKIIIDDTIDDTILFPEKLAEAKAKFAKFGLPKGLKRKTLQNDTMSGAEKLEEANANLAKYGLPKGWEKKIPTKSKELEVH